MKITSILALCGVVAGHAHHEHGEREVPLHKREFVQDSAEELERKWSFEVCFLSCYLSERI